MRVSESAAAFTFFLAIAEPVQAASRQDYLNNAINATDVLNQKWYDEGNGQWMNLWWNSANSLTSLANLAQIAPDQFGSTGNHYFQNTLTAARAANGGSYVNNFYDDEGWWAMAWIRVYDATQDRQYLDVARNIFQDLIKGLGATCGGQWWSKDKNYVASIANELFIEVAASLANRSPNDGTDYRIYANNNLAWLMNSGLINSDNTINDGIDISNCKPTGTVFTYNQGVILGGLVEMHQYSNNQQHLDTANRLAHGALAQLTKDNILTETGYPNALDNTAAQFKGPFVRGLASLQSASPHDEYKTFLQQNADSLWSNDRQDGGELGSNWQGPLTDATAPTQSAALDCLIAAARVS